MIPLTAGLTAGLTACGTLAVDVALPAAAPSAADGPEASTKPVVGSIAAPRLAAFSELPAEPSLDAAAFTTAVATFLSATPARP